MSDKAVPAVADDPLDVELARRLNAWHEAGAADADCTQAATAVVVECGVWLVLGLGLWGWSALQGVML